jgi:hypothetical protein
VAPLEHHAQVLDADASVDGRCLEALVSEQFLDVPDAGFSLEEMGSVRVALIPCAG